MSNVDADLARRLGVLSLEQKVRLLTGADFWSLWPEPAVGLRRLVVSDGPAGVRGERWDERDPSANVPSPTALAASWDEARVERLGRLLAGEARRKGVDVLLAPTVNLHRSPYGGRHFECFSEDPLLTARIGVAYVRGLQAGGVGACVKHVVANDSETDRLTVDARVDERALRELYLAPFETIVRQAGVWAVMAAYNSINGTTATEHPMLREILKDEWAFDGVVMSDWFAARSTEPAANAGLDLVMPGPSGPWGDKLVVAVRDGRVSEATVDDKVLRLLRLAARVGALDGIEPSTPTAQAWPEDAVASELRAAAAAGFVLARNTEVDGAPALPLKASALRRVAVLGPNAEGARTLGGGSATVFPPTLSPRSRACAPPSARTWRSSSVAVAAAPTGSRWPRRRCCAIPRRASPASRCGSSPPTAVSWAGKTGPAPPRLGWAPSCLACPSPTRPPLRSTPACGPRGRHLPGRRVRPRPRPVDPGRPGRARRPYRAPTRGRPGGGDHAPPSAVSAGRAPGRRGGPGRAPLRAGTGGRVRGRRDRDRHLPAECGPADRGRGGVGAGGGIGRRGRCGGGRGRDHRGGGERRLRPRF